MPASQAENVKIISGAAIIGRDVLFRAHNAVETYNARAILSKVSKSERRCFRCRDRPNRAKKNDVKINVRGIVSRCS